MNNNEFIPESILEKNKEYDFESGLDEAIRRISDEIVGDLVITITGSSNDVGKTFLLKSLSKRLIDLGFSISSFSDISSFSRKPHFLTPPNSNERRVLIFDAEYLPYKYSSKKQNILHDKVAILEFSQDNILRQKSESLGLPFTMVDLRLFVYRPDKPFDDNEKEFADIMIRNDNAIDDPYKFRA